jgi:alkanesulfonate monooxygenase SsuD/methylene tetrahydromethanopterin reductase-like flavin-dependent oxidoreductase (luciferase family)
MASELWLRFDIRGAGLAVSSQALCAAAIEQAVWAERNGFDAILFSEHHGTEDGYCPSPMILASAIAARTQSIRLHLGALVVPLSDPIRLAEDVCVLDNISNGRVDVTVGAGYVPSEFAMFGVDIRQRAKLMDEGIVAMRNAFTGQPFKYRDRPVRVSPKPVQPGGPKIYVAGAVKASALRAARLGDGFFPTVYNAELMTLYREECERLGKAPFIIDMSGPVAIHVSRDPERDWARVGPHMLHELNAYSRWARESGTFTPFASDVQDLQTLKNTGIYCVLTPEECLTLFERDRAAGRHIMFNPLCGGLHPDIAWESLELMAKEVLPRFKQSSGATQRTTQGTSS